MTTEMWARLTEPFPADVVKERQGPKRHEGACTKQYGQCTQRHMMLSYVDARDVAERLDYAAGPGGWLFSATAVPNTNVVHGRLSILTDNDNEWTYREDHGYPNSDADEEPLKSATSDALKRCAVLFGIGRHLYDDNHPQKPASRPAERPRTAPSSVPSSDEPPWPVEVVPDPALAAAQEIFGDVVDESKCPDHNKPFKNGSKGWFCATPTAKDGDRVTEWCKRRPSKAWQAAQELAA